jgi:hypothetical protein
MLKLNHNSFTRSGVAHAFLISAVVASAPICHTARRGASGRLRSTAHCMAKEHGIQFRCLRGSGGHRRICIGPRFDEPDRSDTPAVADRLGHPTGARPRRGCHTGTTPSRPSFRLSGQALILRMTGEPRQGDLAWARYQRRCAFPGSQGASVPGLAIEWRTLVCELSIWDLSPERASRARRRSRDVRGWR